MRLGTACFIGSFALGCGQREGIVGVEPLASAGFLEEFAPSHAAWDEQLILPGATTQIGVGAAKARDGYTAELRLPGHDEYGTDDNVGAKYATQLATAERYHFGTYRTRLGFGACKAEEEAVQAFLGFFNDGQDRDGDGIIDDLEIDAQVLCSAPQRLFLTVFTDDEETPRRVFRKQSRMIDFESGEVSDTPRSDSDNFVSAGQDPSFAAPESFAPSELYELGFEWHRESLRFFLVHAGQELTLWSLDGQDQIPQQPVYVMYNLWHPSSHWYPPAASADYPEADVVMRVDWFSFEPE